MAQREHLLSSVNTCREGGRTRLVRKIFATLKVALSANPHR